jgi:type II secretory ATPase GspE/PulE/Tfp pilus assembly ATPase PilB-like protein
MIFQATEAGASDIHLDPTRLGYTIRYRVDGLMTDIAQVPFTLTRSIANRLKVLSNLVVYKDATPQDGRFGTRGSDKGGAGNEESRSAGFRVAFMPTMHGERIVIRILGRESDFLTLRSIGLDENHERRVTRLITQPQGMVILTGPTGSGKTTTIYSALRSIQELTHGERSIATLEDPIECDISGINQSQVDERRDFHFHTGLRALLRQDPDVIMVGEIRDPETARIAIQAGMTGHLIITTVHANSSSAAFSRLIDMGMAPFAINSAVTAVIAQRLVRRICKACRVEHRLTESEIEQLGWKKQPIDFPVYTGSGCSACGGSGYSGRHALFEILEVTEPIRDIISNGASSDAIYAMARKEKMKTLFESGQQAIRSGITTVEEIIRVVVRQQSSKSLPPGISHDYS